MFNPHRRQRKLPIDWFSERSRRLVFSDQMNIDVKTSTITCTAPEATTDNIKNKNSEHAPPSLQRLLMLVRRLMERHDRMEWMTAKYAKRVF